jgi:hypothetical protein
VRLREPWSEKYDVSLRINAAKGLRRRDNTRCLLFQIVERLSKEWRPLNGDVNSMALLPYKAAQFVFDVGYSI